MLSQVITAFGAPLNAVDTPTPEPGGTEVLVKVHHCGVCHTDIHLHDGYFSLGSGKKLELARGVPLPHTLGHEIEGEIIAAGPDATGVVVGARVAVFPWIGCGTCATCQRGEEQNCGRPRQIGCSGRAPGGYATHVLVPHPRYLLDYGAAPPALAATYMCAGLTAFSALKKVGPVAAGDPVLVLGTGGVGMMAIRFAEAVLGQTAFAVDIDDSRLKAALAAGARRAYDANDPDAAKKVKSDTDGGPFAVIDFVGSEASFAFANGVVRRGGRIIVVGLSGGTMTAPLLMIAMRPFSIIGSYTGSLREAREMLDLVRGGNVESIPIDQRPLSGANQALDDLRAGKVVGRVVLTP